MIGDMSGKSARLGAMVVVLVVGCVALNDGVALGRGGSGAVFQVVPPTAATVPPERTVPRVTAARPAVKKKVVRKPTVTVKKAASTAKATVKGVSSTTAPGGATTTVLKPIRATVSGSGTYVAVRSEPDPKAALLKRLPDGTIVSIKCQLVGVAVSDPSAGRKSSLWNELSTGGYITNMYTSLYVDGETKPAQGHSCSDPSGSVSSNPSANLGTATTSPSTVDSSGKIPAKPVITAVS